VDVADDLVADDLAPGRRGPGDRGVVAPPTAAWSNDPSALMSSARSVACTTDGTWRIAHVRAAGGGRRDPPR
jgi:hypothetical protein